MRGGGATLSAIQFVGAFSHLSTEFENGSLQAVFGSHGSFLGLFQQRPLTLDSSLALLQFQLAPVQFHAAAGDIGSRFRNPFEVIRAAGERGPFRGEQRGFKRFQLAGKSASGLGATGAGKVICRPYTSKGSTGRSRERL